MKLLLLKTLLQRRARDEGFTLPMVIALGLVMILLGAINITSANEENLTAITQNSRSDALAIAEIGVTRFRELLDRNRLLTLYDADSSTNEWSGLTQICDGDIASFAPGVSIPVTITENGLDLNNDGDTTDAFVTGSYSLVSYDYNLTSGTFDQTDDADNIDGSGNSATGTLTIRGETPDGNKAQIEVDIPIRINQQDMGNLAPALWIGEDTVSKDDLGDTSLTVNNGNVVIQDSAVTVGTIANGCGNFATLATATGLPIISDPRNLPSIQPIIDTITAAQAVSGDQTNTSISDGILGETNEDAYVVPPVGETFDSSVHCANIRNCRYYYYLNTNQNIDSNLTTDGIANATLYIDDKTLTIDADSNNVIVGSGVASNYFEIYVNGNKDITLKTKAGFTLTINAFIHAPNSTLKITGDGTVDINGSVWVKDIESSTSANVNITPDTSNISSTLSSAAYEFYTTTTSRTPKPLTNSPTNWKTEEVTP